MCGAEGWMPSIGQDRCKLNEAKVHYFIFLILPGEFFLIGLIIFSAFVTKKGSDIRASVRGKQVALGSANVNIFKLLCSVTCSKQLSLSSQSQSGSVMGDGSLHHGRRLGSLPGWHTCSVKGVAPNGTNSGQPWSLSETVSFLKR